MYLINPFPSNKRARGKRVEGALFCVQLKDALPLNVLLNQWLRTSETKLMQHIGTTGQEQQKFGFTR